MPVHVPSDFRFEENGEKAGPSGSDALVIFGRYPRLGEVKTRLSPHLTDESCLELHLALLLDTLDRTSDLAGRAHLYLSDCTYAEAKAFALEHRVDRAFQIRLQKGVSLGDRMWRAYLEVYDSTRNVLFLGADSPSVPLGFLRQAFELMSQVPAVIGPARDGGYYAVGLSSPRHELFSDIPWGTPKVLETTLSRLPRSDYRLLPQWYDIDNQEDLRTLSLDLESDFEGFPRRTSAFLSSLGYRTAAVG